MKPRKMKARIARAERERHPSDLVRYLRKVRDGWTDSAGIPRDGFNAAWAGEHRGRRRVVALLERSITRAAAAEEPILAARRKAKAVEAAAARAAAS